MQYTIRNIPKRLDEALRRKAREEHRSLNEVAVEALEQGVNLNGEKRVHHDLDWFLGSWEHDPEFEKAIREMDQVLPDELREFWGQKSAEESQKGE